VDAALYKPHYCPLGGDKVNNDAELMISPKSRATPRKRKRVKKEHFNKKFYNSKAWRETRSSYLRSLQTRIQREALKGYLTLRNGERLSLQPHQVGYLLSLAFTPCEICLKLYAAEAYSEVMEGEDLDHIEKINPDDALDSAEWGDPFDHNNLQLLCKRHHARKSNRET